MDHTARPARRPARGPAVTVPVSSERPSRPWTVFLRLGLLVAAVATGACSAVATEPTPAPKFGRPELLVANGDSASDDSTNRGPGGYIDPNIR